MNLLVVPELVERANTSLEDFCPAAAFLAPGRLTGIRACSGWKKEKVTAKGSQKIRHCSRHGCWYVKYNPTGMQTLVAARLIPWRAQGGLQGWTTERKKCTNGSKMGKPCQVREKIMCVPVSLPVKAAMLCLWESTYTRTWSCTHTRSAQAHAARDGAHQHLPAMPSASDGAAYADCRVRCCWRGLYSQPRIPSANACAPAWHAGSGERSSWKTTQRKNKDSCSAWDVPWLSLLRGPTSCWRQRKGGFGHVQPGQSCPFWWQCEIRSVWLHMKPPSGSRRSDSEERSRVCFKETCLFIWTVLLD